MIPKMTLPTCLREISDEVRSPGKIIKKDSVNTKLPARQKEKYARDEKCDTLTF